MQTHKQESVRLAPCKSRGGKAATDLWQIQDPLCRRGACERLGPTRRTVHKMKHRNAYCGHYEGSKLAATSSVSLCSCVLVEDSELVLDNLEV